MVHTVDLPKVRRLEAVGFRSWPAASTRFDGTWAIRLTAGHPAKRLNSVNPLDPADHSNLDSRIQRAQQIFQDFGRPLIFRQSPLAPPELENILDARGWRRFDESKVMTKNIQPQTEQCSSYSAVTTDIGHWIDQSIAMQSFDTLLKPGIFELISRISGQVALFLLEEDEKNPIAAAIAVRFDDQVGVFEVITHPERRQRGFARSIIENATLWAMEKQARRIWLQVTVENKPANKLYETLGFKEAYRYSYRQAPGTPS